MFNLGVRILLFKSLKFQISRGNKTLQILIKSITDPTGSKTQTALSGFIIYEITAKPRKDLDGKKKKKKPSQKASETEEE